MWSKQEITKSQNWGRRCCSVANWCLTLCDPMDRSTPGSPVLHYLQECTQIHVFESVMLFNHLIHCRSLLFLPSIFPSIRVFSNELALHIRWPKYWSFSFSRSPSNEYLGLISFRTDWFDLLVVQRTLKSSPIPRKPNLPHTNILMAHQKKKY